MIIMTGGVRNLVLRRGVESKIQCYRYPMGEGDEVSWIGLGLSRSRADHFSARLRLDPGLCQYLPVSASLRAIQACIEPIQPK